MIQRETYLRRIRPFIGQDVIKVMTGIRRSGKSVMLELIRQELLASGVREEQLISYNFEDLRYTHLLNARALHEEILRRAEERSKNMVNVTNEYTEDALRRTEDAIQMALDEIRESRARFRAVSNEQLQAQRAKLEAQNSESDKNQQ